MGDPFVSVIIPTRDRCSTLGPAVSTALDQNVADMEVIVSDNASTDATVKVISEFSDGRLSYIRAPHRMSMCDHWEFALNHARGKYIIFIGDDDGLMPGACERLRRLSETFQAKVFHWDRHEYVWPGADGGPAVALGPPSREPIEFNLVDRARRSVALGGRGWQSLPKLYHSSVARSVLDELRLRTGRVFHSSMPDIFMGYALPAFSDHAVEVGGCLTLNGRSAASLGHASQIGDNPVLGQFRDETRTYRFHPSLVSPLLPEQLKWIANSILVAMRLFPSTYEGVNFNYEASYAIGTAGQPWYDLRRLVGIIQARAELRRHHRFKLLAYLYFFLNFKSGQLAARVRRKISGTPASIAKAQPADVRACAILLGRVARQAGQG